MRKVSGFTIIEVVVAITILGILGRGGATAVLRHPERRPQGGGGRRNGRDRLRRRAQRRRPASAQGNLAGAATVVNQCTVAMLSRVLTGGFPTNIVVSTPRPAA